MPHPDMVRTALERARAAQREAARWSQSRTDEVVAAVGWYCYQESTARRLALLSHAETALGNPEHLHTLQRRRVLGVLRDLHGQSTVGVVEDLPDLGLRRIAKPLGVIAVASPATAPVPGIVCNVLPMLKTRNAAVFSPNPRALRSARATVRVVRDALAKVSAPVDLVQCLEHTDRRTSTELMAGADHVVAIGGAGTVRRAYESGTPAVGAGVGNPTVVVDETADLADAAEKIVTGASYNNGTSCSSESNVLVHTSVLDEFSSQLSAQGAHLCTDAETARLRSILWSADGKLDRDMIGRPATELAEAARIHTARPDKTLLLVLAGDSPLHAGELRDEPILREKISPVLTLGRFDSFAEAVSGVQRLLGICGKGHSCGIHSTRPDRVALLAEAVDSCRVVVNQSTMTNTGSFESGVPFTTTLASGSWGGCSTSGNVTWRTFLNHTLISRPIAARLPDEKLLFGAYRGREAT